jgi:formylglycine-generating enzyme required for sulfatase activity
MTVEEIIRMLDSPAIISDALLEAAKLPFRGDDKVRFEQKRQHYIDGLTDHERPRWVGEMKNFLSMYDGCSVGATDGAEAPPGPQRNEFKTDIFISYARKDLKRVQPIVKELQKKGWNVFWDLEIPPGESWRSYIKKRLDESRCVLVLWSHFSITSEWVIAEADEAKRRGILVPALLDAVEPPFGLSHIHAADLSDWKKDTSCRAFRELVNAVTAKISFSIPTLTNSIPDTAPDTVPTPVVVASTWKQQAPAEREPYQGFLSSKSKQHSLRARVEKGVSAVAGIRTWPVNSQRTVIAVAVLMMVLLAVFAYRSFKSGAIVASSVPAIFQPEIPSSAVLVNYVLIRGGEFTMGSPAKEPEHDSDETQHQVKVSDFYLCKYAVTLADFRKFVEAKGYQTEAETGDGSYVWDGTTWQKRAGINWRYGVSGSVRPQSEENHPVLHVSWKDAVAYCKWMEEKTGKKFRLPTEAEWEYACRAGTTTPFNTGENLSTDQANYYGNYPYNNNEKGEYRKNTVAVDSFAPNAWGLYNMHGNVYEWCGDRYGVNYYEECKTKGIVENPGGPETGSRRVLRGGYWSSDARYCRSAGRGNDAPGLRSSGAGFRLAFVP